MGLKKKHYTGFRCTSQYYCITSLTAGVYTQDPQLISRQTSQYALVLHVQTAAVADKHTRPSGNNCHDGIGGGGGMRRTSHPQELSMSFGQRVSYSYCVARKPSYSQQNLTLPNRHVALGLPSVLSVWAPSPLASGQRWTKQSPRVARVEAAPTKRWWPSPVLNGVIFSLYE